MQNRTKFGLMIVISAFILGTPVFFLSQADGTKGLISIADDSTEKAMQVAMTSSISDINNLPATASGIKPSITAQNDSVPEQEFLSPIDRIRAIQNKSELHQSLIEDHEQFKRYPEYNQVFSNPERDPVVERYDVEERTTQNPEDQSSLSIWSDKKYYLQNDNATIFASLRDAEGEIIPTKFMGQLIYNEQVSLQTIEFSDTNQDGIYEHKITLDDSTESPFKPGVYKVLIVNNTNKVSDAVTFILSEPEISLTGNYRESLSENKQLLIQAEVNVTSPNRFYFQASLYSANQIPIGSTQQSLDLNTGTQWITLVFDGALIRDSEEDGPYLLKHISLAKVTLPMQRAPLKKTEFFTKDYAVEQFESNRQTDNDSLQANNVKN